MTIARPPENTTVCRGSNVTISCGYVRSTAVHVTWIINGTSFTLQEVWESPLYQLNNPTSPNALSLTVFSINDTTTFQCIVHSIRNTTSTLGTVMVTDGMLVCMYILYIYTWLIIMLYSLINYLLCLLESCLNRF